MRLRSGSGSFMASFLGEDSLLSNNTARRLYHDCAVSEPILDYHCHLSPEDIAENRRFANLFEIWLEGDHYKWRALRANGVPEKYITGDATPYEKFLAWARTVPYTLRNPLYYWSHLELERYFGISDLLDEQSAPRIWEQANAALAQDLTAHGILEKFSVEALCTTDDPAEDLKHHRKIAQANLSTRVFPTFRPDRALTITHPDSMRWVDKLGEAANVDIHDFHSFLDAIGKRHDQFHALGCRLSDHGLSHCFANPCSDEAAAAIFAKAQSNKSVTEDEKTQFASFLMLFLGRLDAEKGWTKQLHLGARRNVNSRARQQIGPDSGYDTIGDYAQIGPLAAYLDLLNRENALPKMILYNVNPTDTFSFATLIGSFQQSDQPGKIQYGSAWWFLDQKQGITAQLDALSNTGLLSRFIGMVTDSRSFMSYPRHEYFRRILSDVVGQDVERGELPNDHSLLERLIKDVCYRNAKQYLNLPLSK